MFMQRVKRNLIYLISCMDMFAVSLVIPAFTQYLQSIGLSNFTIGLLNSLYSGVQFLSSPLIGHMSDVFGSKRVLLVSLLVCSASYPVMGIVTSLLSLILVRLVIGFAKHTQLLCKNYIEEFTDEAHVRNFGKLSGFTSLGYIVGPVIGGYIIDLHNGFFYMCCLTGILFCVNCIFVYALSTIHVLKKTPPVYKSFNFICSFKNIPWSMCWDLFLLKCLTVFAVFAFYINYSQSVTSRYNVSSFMVGYSFSVQGIIRTITGFTIHRVNKLFPHHSNILNRIKITYSIVIFSLVCLYFSASFYIYLLFLVPLNVCLCYIRIINHEALIERIKSHNKGIILGAFNNVTAVARFLLPLVTGYMVDRFNYDSVYVISIISLLGGILLVSVRNNEGRVKIE